MRFYLVAMIFIVFDIEIIFLYPFTTVFHRARRRSAWSRSSIFAVAVFESFVYLIANGALDWGPVKHARRSELGIDAHPHVELHGPPGRPRRSRAARRRARRRTSADPADPAHEAA